MQKIKKGETKKVLANIITNTLLVMAFSIWGTIIGIVAGFGIVFFQESDNFTFWKLLDNPIKFTQIDSNTNSYSTIFAKSVENKWYLWDCHTKIRCQWIETQNTPEISYNVRVKKGTSCQFSETHTIKDPPGKVIECVVTSWAAGEGVRVDYFALLDNGKVWHWSKSSDSLGALYLIFISPVICSILGIIIGIAVVSRKKVRRIRK